MEAAKRAMMLRQSGIPIEAFFANFNYFSEGFLDPAPSSMSSYEFSFSAASFKEELVPALRKCYEYRLNS